MQVRLVSKDGFPDIPLDRLLVVVGRDSRCDWPLNSLRVSRRHCCVALDAEGAHIRDLGSANGTWINGRQIEAGYLRPGDELAIAHLRYSLEFSTVIATKPRDDDNECAASDDIPTR